MWTPDGRGLVFTSKVYADCPPLPAGDECNRKRSTAQEQSLVQSASRTGFILPSLG